MRIKGLYKSSLITVVIVIATLIALAFLFNLIDIFKKNSDTGLQSYYCNSESSDGDNFITKTVVFGNGQCQSSEMSFSGKFSCKCTSESKYGMSLKLDNLAPGDTVISSVWIKKSDIGNGTLVFSSEKNKIYQSKSEASASKKGWELLCDTILVLSDFIPAPSVIYPYMSSQQGEVYFDDFEVVVRSGRFQTGIEPFNAPEIHIRVTTPNYNNLLEKRNEAYNIGLLYTSKADLVDGNIKIEDQDYACKLRLKGDLLDHLIGDNWSFRIELKGNKEWRNMSTFSVHNSQSRSHLAEWYMHKIFQKEGIITPEYDFTHVYFNNKDLGVYAYEQHFDNNLLEANNRQLGPILRHNDEGYWDNVLEDLEPFHWIVSSQIELFNKQNVSNPEFKKLFDYGHSMLYDFIHERKQANAVFDIELMAKYYALIELSHADHAQLYTNIRFYMNPFTGKLEPIAYDCFGDHLPKVTEDWAAMGEGAHYNKNINALFAEVNVYRKLLFRDNDFYRAYMQYLNKYTSNDYLDGIKNELKDLANSRQMFIRTDKKYSNYTYLWENIFKKASFTNKKIYPKSNYSLKAYLKGVSRQNIQLESYHYFPLEIIGFGNGERIDTLDRSVFIPPYNPNTGISPQLFNLQNPVNKVYYKVLGLDSIFNIEIPKLEAPLRDIPIVKANIEDLKKYSFINISGNTLTVKPGNHVISDALIIPNGYSLIIPAGTALRFKDNGSLLSYGPINATGSKNEIIQFIGASKIGQAINIIGAHGSKFSYCHFSQFSKYSFRNIQNEGGLVFYNSEAKLDHCTLIDMVGKDALSIVNSNVTLDHINFTNCQGDGIDSYFSSGIMNDLSFKRIGKDALEISGGNITVNNLIGDNILNQGIRANNRAYLVINNFVLNNSYYGISASEHSDIRIYGATFSNLKRAFEVLSEGEPNTSVMVNNYNSESIDQEYLIQQNATLRLNDELKKPY